MTQQEPVNALNYMLLTWDRYIHNMSRLTMCRGANSSHTWDNGIAVKSVKNMTFCNAKIKVSKGCGNVNVYNNKYGFNL